MLVFLICLVTLSGSEENKYDKFGSIGGLLGGFFLALATAIPVREGGSYEKKCSIFGWTFTIIQISICLLMIYIAEWFFFHYIKTIKNFNFNFNINILYINLYFNVLDSLLSMEGLENNSNLLSFPNKIHEYLAII